MPENSEKLLDIIEDYEEEVRVLEHNRNYLRLCLQEEQVQLRDDSKVCLKDKSCAVGHGLKNNKKPKG